MVPEARTFFFVDGGPKTLCSKRGTSGSLRCTYCDRSLSFRSQAGSKKPRYSDGLRRWKLRGCTDVRKRHGVRSMMARTSTERLVASTIWSRENPLFPAHRHHGVNTTHPSIYKQMLYHAGFRGRGILIDPLYRCTTVQYLTYNLVFFLLKCYFVHMDESSDIQKTFASLNPRIALIWLRVFA